METSGSAAQQEAPAAPPPAEHPLVVRFAAWMTGSQRAGRLLLKYEADPAPVPGRDRLGRGRNQLVEPTSPLTARLRRLAWLVMADRRGAGIDLDEGLGRYDGTRALSLGHPLIRGDVRRLHVLQRELQRRCLSTALGNLPSGPRVAFVLLVILGLTEDQATEVMGTREAVKTNRIRALRDLHEALEPVCEHLDPANGCCCRNRLAGAVERGFVTWPDPDRDDLDGDEPLIARMPAELEALYKKLPQPPE